VPPQGGPAAVYRPSLRLCAESGKERAVPTYDIEITHHGRWWMIHTPALDRITQARRRGEIAEMACDYIAVSTDGPTGGRSMFLE
jgi:hypothetical protein